MYKRQRSKNSHNLTTGTGFVCLFFSAAQNKVFHFFFIVMYLDVYYQ